jgi:hypothetical protein
MRIKCICQHCNKEIVVNVPKEDYIKDKERCSTGNSCNSCIPENSAARDGINESIYTEVKKKENANDKMIKWLNKL